MPTTEKFCSSCKQQTIHNRGKKDGGGDNYLWRCTYCGHPVTTNVAKKEQQEYVRKTQVNKLESRRKLGLS